MGHVDPTEPWERSLGRLLRVAAGQVDVANLEPLMQQLQATRVGRQDNAVSLEQVRATALECHTDSTRRHRREGELSALVRLAQGLLAASNLEESLQVLVGVARDLFAADVAHVNAPLGTGQDYQSVRSIQGAMTEAFRQQRTPAGAGLTGLVTESKSPYVSVDYLRDPRIKHTPAGDASVRADGLHTLAGVPLLVRDQVVAVLIVSYRSPTVISDEQLGLLVSLGTMASLAIHRARVTDESASVARMVQEESGQLKEQNYYLRWSERAISELLHILTSGGNADVLLEAVSRAFNASTCLLEPDGSLLAGTAPSSASTLAELAEVASELVTQPVSVRPNGGKPVGWRMPIVFGREHFGSLYVERETMNDSESKTLRYAAQVAAALMHGGQFSDSKSELDDSAIDALLGGLEPIDDGWKSIVSVRVKRRDLVAAVIISQPDDMYRLRRAAHRLVQESSGLLGFNEHALVLMSPAEGNAESTARNLERNLSVTAKAQVIVGASYCPSVEGLPTAVSTAGNCARSLRRLGLRNGYATPGSLGRVGVLLGDDSDTASLDFINESIGPLVQYDATRGTQLVDTLRAYLLHGESLKLAAGDLHVHSNTVLQRLQRISAILGSEDWRNEPDKKLQMQLAIRLHGSDGRAREGDGGPSM